MSEEKFTPGYDVTPDGRVFSLTSNWRGYGIRLCMLMHPDCEGCEICDTRKVLMKARGEE